MTDDMSMWDDPQESSALRQLLRAGRVENSDYDVDRGLARHLAQLQAGTPLPAWAVQTTLQKSASWSILAWLLPPVISAGVVGAWLTIRPADAPPVSLVPALPPPAAAPASTTTIAPASALKAAAAVVQVQEPTGAAAAVVPSLAAESGGQDLREPNDHHAALTRASRQPARVVSTRRSRSARSEDATPYTTVTTVTTVQSTRDASGIGSGAGLSTANTKATADESATMVASKKVEPTVAVQEPVPAPAEETKAKAERRNKEEEGVAKVDEVSGARLEREMRMLAVAQRVLAEDPARSLRLCRQGESEFRGSMFSAERKQVALLALVQLGKVEQARREGIPFLRAYPNAPWSARLREALSTGRVPNP